MPDKNRPFVIALEEHYWDADVAKHFDSPESRNAELRRRLDDSESGLANLLTSHPPIERRIAILNRMAGFAQPQVSGSRVQGSSVQGV